MQVLHPLFDRILVSRDEVSNKVGNIIIPDGAKEPPNIGTVVGVGEGRLCTTIKSSYSQNECHVEPLRVKLGDRIVFQSYAGTDIADIITGKSLLLMREDDVLAIIKNTPDQPDVPSNDTLSDPNE